MNQEERIDKLFNEFREAIRKEFGMMEPVKRFKAPTLEEVVNYFDHNGYTLIAGQKAFNYYDAAGWKDSTGKQIRNWKQKMVGVWFKDENKKPFVKKHDPTNVW